MDQTTTPALGIQGLSERNRTEVVEGQYNSAHSQDINSDSTSKLFQSVVALNERERVRIALPIASEPTVNHSNHPSVSLDSGECNKDENYFPDMVPNELSLNRTACVPMISPTTIELLADAVKVPPATMISEYRF